MPPQIASARDIPHDEQHDFLDYAKAFEWDRVKRLVNAKPPLVNVQPAMRWSALHQAAFSGDVDTVRFLLGHDADIDARTSDDKTPFDVAKTAKVKSILSEFASSGALPTPLRKASISDRAHVVPQLGGPIKVKTYIKAMKTAKQPKVMKKTIAKGKRSKAMVYRGLFKKTIGGLTKDALTKNKAGKIVSMRKQTQGKKCYANIKGWVEAFVKARAEMGIGGFVPLKKGSELYIKTMELYTRGSP